jgi:hypothetical protein
MREARGSDRTYFGHALPNRVDGFTELEGAIASPSSPAESSLCHLSQQSIKSDVWFCR